MTQLLAGVAIVAIALWAWALRSPAAGRLGHSAPVVAFAAVGAAVWPPWGVMAGSIVPIRRVLLDRRRRRLRAAALLSDTVAATNLLGLVVAGGATVRGALADVIPWMNGDLGAELGRAMDRSERAGLLADELDSLPARDVAAVRRLVAVLAGAERYGVPIVSGLEALGEDLAAAQRRALEAAARRVPVRLLGPLLLGVLPAFMLLSIVPMLIGALDGLRTP